MTPDPTARRTIALRALPILEDARTVAERRNMLDGRANARAANQRRVERIEKELALEAKKAAKAQAELVNSLLAKEGVLDATQ